MEGAAPPQRTAVHKYLPYAAVLGAGTFLGLSGYLGYKLGARKVAKSEAKDGKLGGKGAAEEAVLDTRKLMKAPVASGARGMTAGQLAGRALLYGTALCGAGSLTAVLVLSYALDFKDADGFAQRMRERLPSLRAGIEGTIGPALNALAGGLAGVVAPAVRDSVGAFIASNVPATSAVKEGTTAAGAGGAGAGGRAGAGAGDDLQLSKSDQKALEALAKLFSEDEPLQAQAQAVTGSKQQQQPLR